MKHFSLLDLSPIPEGKNAADALKNTVELAQAAEGFGYHLYWLAEHSYLTRTASYNYNFVFHKNIYDN